MENVDVYPVGLWREIHQARVNWRAGRRDHAGACLHRALRSPLRDARARHWRALKNQFNGYLAEPAEFPPGVPRCGSGWTRRRALRDWQRRAARA